MSSEQQAVVPREAWIALDALARIARTATRDVSAFSRGRNTIIVARGLSSFRSKRPAFFVRIPSQPRGACRSGYLAISYSVHGVLLDLTVLVNDKSLCNNHDNNRYH